MKLERATSQLRLLDHLLKEKDWNFLKELDVKDSEFRGQASVILKFIREYHSDSNEFPPKDFVVEETGIEFPSEVAKTAAIKKFQDKLIEKKAGQYVDQIQRALIAQNPQKTVSLFKEGAANLVYKNNKSTSFKLELNARHDNYEKNRQSPLKGVLPPFKTWQNNIIRWKKGTFSTVLGIQHSGKSYLMAISALHAAFVQGFKVLLVSKENTRDSTELRLDALKFNLDFSKLQTGLLDFRVVNRWQEQIPEVAKQAGDIQILDGTQVQSVADIYQEFLVTKPDLVLVDGAYLFSSADFVDSSKLLQDFCHYALLSDVPWVGTSQLKMTANDINLTTREIADHARGNKGWVIDVDNSISIRQPKELNQLGNVVRLDFLKDRDGGDKSQVKDHFYLKMNMKQMTIEEYDLGNYVNDELLF